MEDTIIDLTEFDHDDIAMRIRRVSDYLIDTDPSAEFLPPLSEDDQYRKDMEVLIEWVNTPDIE